MTAPRRTYFPESSRPRREADCIARAAYVAALAKIGDRPKAEILRSLYPDDEITCAIVTRAATTPADTRGTGWAAEFGSTVVIDFVASLKPISAAARLVDAGGRVSMAGVNTVLIPRRTTALPDASLAWVEQGAPAAIKQYSFSAASMGPPKKLEIGSALTREMLVHGGEAVVRTTLVEDTAATLDATMFGTDAATNAAPTGLLNGVTPINATAGGGDTAMLTDLENLGGAIGTAGGTEPMYFAHPAQAESARLRLGRYNDVVVYPTLGLPLKSIAAIDARAFVSGFGSEPEIEASMETAVHFADSSPQPIVSSGSVVAAPVYSAWQADMVVLKCRLTCAWLMRQANLIAVVNNATWGRADMTDDDDLIVLARQREADGRDDALDQYRLKAAERQERVTKDARPLDIVYKTHDDGLSEWADWFDAQFDRAVRERLIDSVGEAMAQSRADTRNEFKEMLHKLAVEVAELRGELRALCSKRRPSDAT
jgi:hypothetical protein